MVSGHQNGWDAGVKKVPAANRSGGVPYQCPRGAQVNALPGTTAIHGDRAENQPPRWPLVSENPSCVPVSQQQASWPITQQQQIQHNTSAPTHPPTQHHVWTANQNAVFDQIDGCIQIPADDFVWCDQSQNQGYVQKVQPNTYPVPTHSAPSYHHAAHTPAPQQQIRAGSTQPIHQPQQPPTQHTNPLAAATYATPHAPHVAQGGSSTHHASTAQQYTSSVGTAPFYPLQSIQPRMETGLNVAVLPQTVPVGLGVETTTSCVTSQAPSPGPPPIYCDIIPAPGETLSDYIIRCLDSPYPLVPISLECLNLAGEIAHMRQEWGWAFPNLKRAANA